MRQELVIGGFTAPQGGRNKFGALLVGVYEGGALKYAGKVGTGFDEAMLEELSALMKPLVQGKPAFANPPTGYEARGVTWIKPKLVAEIAFTEWTPQASLRHPSFQGLRQDKQAKDVVREGPAGDGGAAAPSKSSAVPTKGKARVDKAITADGVAGVTISNPSKELYPESHITKRDLALFYQAIAPWLLPHLHDRPLSLVRCPNGWEKQTFYQKNADASTSPAIDRVQVTTSDGPATYMMANSTEAVVSLLQMGVLEIHPWGSSAGNLDKPDRIIFDFDPDDGVGWTEVVEAARLCRTLLNKIELECYVKTTGGKGLHVVVPLQPAADWPTGKAFAKAVADLMVGAFPDRFTSQMAKARRTGKIFIDYLRNDEGSTAVAAFSTRARAKAPVAMTLSWDDLGKRDLRFDYFNTKNAVAYLKKRKVDPWANFFKAKQSLTPSILARLGVEGKMEPPARNNRWRKRKESEHG